MKSIRKGCAALVVAALAMQVAMQAVTDTAVAAVLPATASVAPSTVASALADDQSASPAQSVPEATATAPEQTPSDPTPAGSGMASADPGSAASAAGGGSGATGASRSDVSAQKKIKGNLKVSKVKVSKGKRGLTARIDWNKHLIKQGKYHNFRVRVVAIPKQVADPITVLYSQHKAKRPKHGVTQLNIKWSKKKSRKFRTASQVVLSVSQHHIAPHYPTRKFHLNQIVTTYLKGGRKSRAFEAGLITRATASQSCNPGPHAVIGPTCDLTGADLSGTDLTGITFSGTVGQPVEIFGTIFTKATLEQSAFSYVDAGQAVFDNASMSGSTLGPGYFPKTSFQGTVLSNLTISAGGQGGGQMSFSQANFAGAVLTPMSVTNGSPNQLVDMRGVNFNGANLTNWDFTYIVIDPGPGGATFAGAILSGVSGLSFPVISSVTPNAGSTKGGTNVSVNGAGFASGQSVSIRNNYGGVQCAVSTTTAYVISCQTQGPSQPGVYDVEVDSGQGTAVLPQSFNIVGGQDIVIATAGALQVISTAERDPNPVPPTTLLTVSNTPSSVACSGHWVYWQSNAGIGRVNVDGTGANRSFITLSSAATSIAADGQYVYWTQQSQGTVSRAPLSNPSQVQVLQSGLNSPAGIFNTNQHLFVALADSIGRMLLNGDDFNPAFIPSAQAGTPISVTGDFQEQNLYWTQSNHAGVYSAAIHVPPGTLPSLFGTINQLSPGQAPSSLAYADDQNDLFWTSAGSAPIGQVGNPQIQSCCQNQIATQYNVNASAMTYLDASAGQPSITSVSAFNGSSSPVKISTFGGDLLTINGTGFSPFSTVRVGGSDCLIQSQGSSIQCLMSAHPAAGPATVVVYGQGDNSAQLLNAVTFDPTAYLYSLTESGTVRTSLSGSGPAALVPNSAGEGPGVVVDGRRYSYNLSTGSNGAFFVSNSDGSNSAQLGSATLSGLTDTIAADHDYIYYPYGNSILRLYHDGTVAPALITNLPSTPTTMSIGQDGYLYWTYLAGYPEVDSIGRVRLSDGGDANPEFITGVAAFSVVETGGYVYWSAFDTGDLGRAPTSDPGNITPSLLPTSLGSNSWISLATDTTKVYWSGYQQPIGAATLDGSWSDYQFISAAASHNSGMISVPAVQAPPPSVTGIQSPTGSTFGGDNVTVSGSNFSASPNVQIGAVACATAGTPTSSTIGCTTGQHAYSMSDVQVFNADGQYSTLPGAFHYSPPVPTVTSVAPPGGPLAGGQDVVIHGTGFVQGATATIGGVDCTNPSAELSPENPDNLNPPPTVLQCTTGQGPQIGPVSVVVTNPDVSGTKTSSPLANGFIYQGQTPSIYEVNPNYGAISGGTPIQVQGQNFDPVRSTVQVNGQTCTPYLTGNNSSGQLNCLTPESTAGPVTITVTNPDTQVATLNDAFTYVPLGPTITSVSPGQLSYGMLNQTVRLTGTGFNANQLNVAFTVSNGDAIPCPVQGSVTQTTITCQIADYGGWMPKSDAGTSLTVRVSQTYTLNAGTPQEKDYKLSGHLDNAVTAGYLQPAITSVSPNVLTAGDQGPITITGTNLNPDDAITVGGLHCASTHPAWNGSLQCNVSSQIPAGAADVVVSNPVHSVTAPGALVMTQTAKPVSMGWIDGGANYTFGLTGTVRVLPDTANPGNAAPLPGSPVAMTSLVNDGQYYYWINNQLGVDQPPVTIARAKMDGSEVDNTWFTMTGLDPVSLYVDDTNIYWLNGYASGNPMTQTIGRASKANPSSDANINVAQSTSQAEFADGIAGDGTYLYWTDFANGQIMRAPKSDLSASSVFVNAADAGAVALSITVGGGYLYWWNNQGLPDNTLWNLGRVATDGSDSPNDMFALAQTDGQMRPALDGNYIYFVDDEGSIRQLHMDGTGWPDPQDQNSLVPRVYVSNGNNPVSLTTIDGYPQISSLSPSQATTDGGDTLTIKGSGFNADTVIQVGGIQCPFNAAITGSELQCTLPAHVTAGPVSVEAINSDTGQTSTRTFTYVASQPATITSIAGDTGSVNGGNTVTINGTWIDPGAIVTLGGVACAVTSSSPQLSSAPTSVKCTAGAHAAGAVDVVLTNPGMSPVTDAGAYTYSVGAMLFWGNTNTNANSAPGTLGKSAADGSSAVANLISTATGGQVGGIALDSQYVYWTDEYNNAIGRAKLDGSQLNQNFVSCTGSCSGNIINGPMGIAVDDGYIYWANNFGSTIGRASKADGSGAANYVTLASGSPQSVAVGEDTLFWTVTNGTSIDSVATNAPSATPASAMTCPVSTPACVSGPSALVYANGQLYWSNGVSSGSIWGSMNGGTATALLTGLSSPAALAVSASQIFWATSSAISSASLSAPTNPAQQDPVLAEPPSITAPVALAVN